MKGVVAEVAVHRGYLYLKMLEVWPEYRGLGLARKKLHQLCLAADRARLPVELLATPCGDGVEFERLCGLYREFGFEDSAPRGESRVWGYVHYMQAMIRLPMPKGGTMAKQEKRVVVESKTIRVSGKDLPMPPAKMVGIRIKNADDKYRVGEGGVVEKRR
jgi:hypothetical protein